MSDTMAAPALHRPRILGIPTSPLNHRRWQNFRRNRRSFYSAIIFLVLFVLSLFAEFIANDKPLLVSFDGELLMPVFVSYPETRFGGDFETEADYRDEFVQELIAEKDGWMVWPLIPYANGTIDDGDGQSHPVGPYRDHYLGTDDAGRDVVARAIYGYRLSVSFGLMLTIISSVVGIAAGAVQGFYGGILDLAMQRFIEVWEGLPFLYIMIILSAALVPGFWTLLGILLLFSWAGLVSVVRAEFLRARNFEYVRAARALGVSDTTVMFKHLLPNAMVATITFMPFILTGAMTSLTALDLLGLGMPPGTPSLGELLAQGKANLHAPWLGITSFVVLSVLLSTAMFMAEGVRDAFDPRKTLD